MSVFKLLVKIGGDAGDLVKSMDGAVGHIKGTFGKMAEIAAGNLIADGIANMAQGMMDFARGAVDHLAEVEQINAQTAAAIRSTGGAAGVSAEQLANLADTLERNTGVSGEMIQAGGNLLLTFTNIKNGVGQGNDVFNQTVGIMADMSVALGQDAKSSAVQLGKALNDPINGVSALQRVGVSFTDTQKDQIKAMVAAGDTMGAQKLILRELRTEFGGSAEAFGGTFRGSMEKATASLEGLGDAILGQAMPALKGMTDLVSRTFNNLADSINELGIGGTLNKIFGPEAKAAIIGIGSAIAIALIPSLTAAATAFGATVLAAAPFIATAAVVAGAAYIIMQNWDPISAFFVDLWNGVSGGIRGLYDNFKSVFDGIGGVVATVINFIRDKFGWMANLLPKGMRDAMTGVSTALGGLPTVVTKTVTGAASSLAKLAPVAGNVQAGFASLAQGVTNSMGTVSGVVTKDAKKAAERIADVWKELKISTEMAKAFNTGGDALRAELNAIESAYKKLRDEGVDPNNKAMKDLMGRHRDLQKAIEDTKKVLYDAGKAVTDVKDALIAAETKSKLFAGSFDLAEERGKILKKGLEDLAEHGVKPNDAAMQELIKQAQALGIDLTKLGGDTKKAKSDFDSFRTSATEVNSAISGLHSGLSTIAETLGVKLEDPVSKGVLAFSNLMGAALQVATSVNTLIPILTNMDLVTKALTAAQWLWNVAMTANPIGVIVVGIGALIAAGALLIANWDSVAKFMGGIWDAIATGGKAAFQGLVDFIGWVWGGLVEVLKWPLNMWIEGLNLLIRGFNAVSGLVPGLGDKLQIPEIPKLAKGGVATGATMAVIGEGRSNEAVLPLTKSIFDQIGAGIAQAPAFAGAGGGGGGTTLVFNIERISSERDADEVGERIVRRLRQAGVKL